MSVNAESMKAIRKELKELYPNLKFSVRKRDYCCVHVDVLEGNINFFQYVTERGKRYYTNETKGYFSVNEFYINDHFEGESLDLFKKILETIYKHVGRHYNSNADLQGADYPAWNYHIFMSVGQYDSPYVLKAS